VEDAAVVASLATVAGDETAEAARLTEVADVLASHAVGGTSELAHAAHTVADTADVTEAGGDVVSAHAVGDSTDGAEATAEIAEGASATTAPLSGRSRGRKGSKEADFEHL